MAKVISAKDAAALVQDNSTLALQGIICTSVPQYLINALRDRYLETQSPKNITLYYEASLGDNAEGGANALALDGLIGKLKCAHVGTAPTGEEDWGVAVVAQDLKVGAGAEVPAAAMITKNVKGVKA